MSALDAACLVNVPRPQFVTQVFCCKCVNIPDQHHQELFSQILETLQSHSRNDYTAMKSKLTYLICVKSVECPS